MKHITPGLVLSLFALLLGISQSTQAQQYYRWVDANGTVHFSEPPR